MNTINEAAERKRFEAWMRKECGADDESLQLHEDGRYAWGRTADMRAAWLESRATQRAEPAPSGVETDLLAELDDLTTGAIESGLRAEWARRIQTRLTAAMARQASHGAAAVDLSAQPVAWRIWRSDRWCFAYSANRDFYRSEKWEPLYTTIPASANSAADARDAWISVEDRMPEVGVGVMVYSPPLAGDGPEDFRLDFDCIDPNDDDHASWLNHNENYEHYCCVGKPEGSIGPKEKAPYTHWQPLPAPPIADTPLPGVFTDAESLFDAMGVDDKSIAALEIDAARWRYLEDHASAAGGGNGFMISCWVPVDHEDMGCGIDAAIAAIPAKEA